MTNLLVSTDWLERHLHDPNLRIIDVRGHITLASGISWNYLNHYEDYVQGHIPGAVFIDWVDEINNDPQHMQVVEPTKFANAMGRAGITPDTFVVVYDDLNGGIAARLWWALNYYGHEKVAVLDGGWNKWIGEERPNKIEMPSFTQTDFHAAPNEALRRKGHEVLAQLNSTTRLVDVRPRDEYTGETIRARQAGHIPGAINLPATDLVAADGTLHQPDNLNNICRQAGIGEADPDFIVYSNVGVEACLGMLALRATGRLNISIYDGSWQEWGNDPEKPVE
jgi:thiosulfate/3-mercaptopyruvate sulfurtransferase